MSQRQTQTLLLGLVLVGFALRVYHLGESAFRGDEAFTVQYWIQTPLSAALQTFITIDPQPLLAYASYHLWGNLVGLQEFAVRMLPALVGTLGIPFSYRLTRRMLGKRGVALIVAAAWTLHPFLIWHSQDARNYILWSTASVAALWLALRALESRRPRDWLAYVLAATLAAYLYYLELFIVAALSVYVLVAYWRQWRVYRRWLFAVLAIGGLLAPWYLQPSLLSGGGYGGTTTGFVWWKLLRTFPATLMFGTLPPSTLQQWAWLFVWVALAVGVVSAYRQDQRLALLLVSTGLLPGAMLAFVSLKLNVMAPRYILSVIPAWLVLLALPLTGHDWQRWGGAVIVAGWAALALISLGYYTTSYSKAPDWNALMAYLNQQVSPQDLVIQTSTDASFGYYYREVYHIPAQERALPAEPDQPVADIQSALADASRAYPSMWLAAQGFTDWQSYGVVESWMDTNMQRVIDTSAAGLRAQQYMPWAVPPGEITVEAPLATFDDMTELVDVRVIQPIQPTGELTVWLYWRPLRQTEVPLKVFVHLAGDFNPAANSPLWSQADHEPQNGRTSTTTWQAGELYRDVYHLPGVSAMPPGSYTLTAGLYDPATGERVRTANGDDAYTIRKITLP